MNALIFGGTRSSTSLRDHQALEVFRMPGEVGLDVIVDLLAQLLGEMPRCAAYLTGETARRNSVADCHEADYSREATILQNKEKVMPKTTGISKRLSSKRRNSADRAVETQTHDPKVLVQKMQTKKSQSAVAALLTMTAGDMRAALERIVPR